MLIIVSMITRNVCTIYLLTNTVNGKLYIGQTWQTLNKRITQHRSRAKNPQWYLYNAISKYGWENFRIDVLMSCHDQATADYWEDFYILAGDTINGGYNLKRGGSKGCSLSEKTKRKIGKSHKGMKHTEETKQQISRAKTGVKRPPGTGQKQSATTIARGSQRGANNPAAKLSVKTVKAIKRMLVKGELTHKQIAEITKIDRRHISSIASGTRWAHVKVRGDFSPRNKGEKHPRSKLTAKKVRAIRKLYFAKGWNINRIAKKYGVGYTSIQGIIEGRYWKHVK